MSATAAPSVAKVCDGGGMLLSGTYNECNEHDENPCCRAGSCDCGNSAIPQRFAFVFIVVILVTARSMRISPYLASCRSSNYF